jgi:hypothetical protein
VDACSKQHQFELAMITKQQEIALEEVMKKEEEQLMNIVMLM